MENYGVSSCAQKCLNFTIANRLVGGINVQMYNADNYLAQVVEPFFVCYQNTFFPILATWIC